MRYAIPPPQNGSQVLNAWKLSDISLKSEYVFLRIHQWKTNLV